MTEEQQVDRRVTRTKRMIRDALTELMEEKGFDGITVKDLTERADINRGTFYIHYKDKYDLLEQSEAEMITAIISLAESGIINIAASYKKSPAQWVLLPFIEKLFELLQENAAFMRVVLGPKGDPLFQKKLKDVIRQKALQVLTTFGGDLMVPAEYLTAYISSAHLGVIQDWLENGMLTSPKEMAYNLAQMTLLGPGYVAGVTRGYLNAMNKKLESERPRS
ncbi:TetR/AcrR family transcriptional regulator [Paenibacillus nanensis]|uniref:TetR/AcrR family transcriptional regulator n=1 Tax=Paenibacillus nanensis TaxID=393251 RepID=A0A3A1VI91_9BACL|nr:TetR/AcrR family transcriptional regulator [Paenibacillus nanensis]RIX60024.1 TetR/AcrR family transcriptional regulator [Paenibacillus nanensis]